MQTLKYVDETDRSFGAAGMAIGLVVYRSGDLMASVSLDREPGKMMEMAPEYYFAGSPEVSAKSSWRQTLGNYNVSVVMSLANVLCRTLGAHGKPPKPETRASLREVAAQEGRDVCQLDDDEIDRLFDQKYDYLSDVFSHYGVRSLAHDMADALVRRRELSRMDVMEMLEALGGL